MVGAVQEQAWGVWVQEETLRPAEGSEEAAEEEGESQAPSGRRRRRRARAVGLPWAGGWVLWAGERQGAGAQEQAGRRGEHRCGVQEEQPRPPGAESPPRRSGSQPGLCPGSVGSVAEEGRASGQQEVGLRAQHQPQAERESRDEPSGLGATAWGRCQEECHSGGQEGGERRGVQEQGERVRGVQPGRYHL